MIGGVLVVIAIAAKIPFFLSTLAIFLSARNGPPARLPANVGHVWLFSASATLLGYLMGFRLIRGKRKLLLFLRRFGY